MPYVGVDVRHRPRTGRDADRFFTELGLRSVPGEFGVARVVVRDRHVVHLKERVVRVRGLLFEYVERGARDLTRLERPDQRRLIDYRPAGAVEHVRGRFHDFELAVAEHVVRRVVQIDVRAHVVGHAAHLVHAEERLDNRTP